MHQNNGVMTRGKRQRLEEAFNCAPARQTVPIYTSRRSSLVASQQDGPQSTDVAPALPRFDQPDVSLDPVNRITRLPPILQPQDGRLILEPFYAIGTVYSTSKQRKNGKSSAQTATRPIKPKIPKPKKTSGKCGHPPKIPQRHSQNEDDATTARPTRGRPTTRVHIARKFESPSPVRKLQPDGNVPKGPRKARSATRRPLPPLGEHNDILVIDSRDEKCLPLKKRTSLQVQNDFHSKDSDPTRHDGNDRPAQVVLESGEVLHINRVLKQKEDVDQSNNNFNAQPSCGHNLTRSASASLRQDPIANTNNVQSPAKRSRSYDAYLKLAAESSRKTAKYRECVELLRSFKNTFRFILDEGEIASMVSQLSKKTDVWFNMPTIKK